MKNLGRELFGHPSGASGSHGGFNIGAMGEIGPGGKHAGRVVGLIPALKLAGDVGGPLASAILAHRKKMKDFNDAEAFPLAGTSPDGQIIQEDDDLQGKVRPNVTP